MSTRPILIELTPEEATQTLLALGTFSLGDGHPPGARANHDEVSRRVRRKILAAYGRENAKREQRA